MSLFYEIHKDIPREGPGDNISTHRALSLLYDLPKKPMVLDIGCGPGMQTLEIAKHLSGHIIGVDINNGFLEQLNNKARKLDLSHKIEILNMSMFELDFEEASFDLMWSEGAIYIMGFQEGIQAWQKYLKKGGYLVVSEISWLREDLPLKPKEFWTREYPQMTNISSNIKMIESSGYIPIGHFVIPENAWWDHYYTPLKVRVEVVREKYRDNEEANHLLDATIHEIEMYKNYSDYYGYVFYIMKKI
jgi:ubiquinone/menaquinone biosynthesis C-methylase UbiE